MQAAGFEPLALVVQPVRPVLAARAAEPGRQRRVAASLVVQTVVAGAAVRPVPEGARLALMPEAVARCAVRC